jgi:hypothetical protein
VLKARYPDCTNYEGLKVLLFKNTTIEEVYRQKHLDPHFTNNRNVIAPFARFEPTREGWDAAVMLAERL